MKRLILFCLATILSQFTFAQVIQYSIVDATKGTPIQGVEVFSHEDHTKISYTNEYGLVLFDTDHTDTLIFVKKNYHPLYIQVRHTNFDTTHTIVLKMVAAEGFPHHNVTSKFDKYQASHYHFVHDSLANSSISVTQFHPTMPPPKYDDKAFHVVEIGLDRNSAHKRTSYNRK